MIKPIYARTLERCLQMSLLFAMVSMFWAGISVLMFALKLQIIGRIMVGIYTFGIFYIGLISIFLPLIVAVVFEKQKRTNTENDKAKYFRKESKYLRPIRYLLVLFKLNGECSSQNNGNNYTQYSHYKPEIAHVVYPATLIVKSIIKRLATKCKQNLYRNLLTFIKISVY